MLSIWTWGKELGVWSDKTYMFDCPDCGKLITMRIRHDVRLKKECDFCAARLPSPDGLFKYQEYRYLYYKGKNL